MALGLPADGALDAVHVRDAFREKALATHPDRAVGDDAAFVEARAARDYLSGVVDEDARVTRRLPLLIEALGPAGVGDVGRVDEHLEDERPVGCK